MPAKAPNTRSVPEQRAPRKTLNVLSRTRCASRLVAITDKRLSPDARLVYMLLDDYAGLKGIAWPKQATIASRLGISLRKVQMALKQLAETGWLRLERTGRASRYHLRWAWVSDPAPAADRHSVYEPVCKKPEVSRAAEPVDGGAENFSDRLNSPPQCRQTGEKLSETLGEFSEHETKELKTLGNSRQRGWVDRHEVRRRELLEGMALISSIMARGQGHGIARPRKKSES